MEYLAKRILDGGGNIIGYENIKKVRGRVLTLKDHDKLRGVDTDCPMANWNDADPDNEHWEIIEDSALKSTVTTKRARQATDRADVKTWLATFDAANIVSVTDCKDAIAELTKMVKILLDE